VARLVALLPALAGVVDAVILRWKSADARIQIDAARRLAALESRPALLISDRLDVGLAAGLDGVQLPEGGAVPTDIRRVWPDAQIGISRHDSDGVRARSEGADFALISPLFPTDSKPGVEGLGPQRFNVIARACPVVTVAMGGINPDNAATALAAGAAGVAVRAAVFGHADPVSRARAIREALDSAGAGLPDDDFVPGPDGGVRPE